MEDDPLKDLHSVKFMVSALARGHFSRKRALNWFNVSDRAKVGFNLQSSAWNERKGYGRHYINLGCSMPEFCSEGRVYDRSATNISLFPMRIRYRAQLPNGELVDNPPWFDDECEMPVQDRERLIRATLLDEVFPLADKLMNIEWVKSAYENGSLRKVGLMSVPVILQRLNIRDGG